MSQLQYLCFTVANIFNQSEGRKLLCAADKMAPAKGGKRKKCKNKGELRKEGAAKGNTNTGDGKSKNLGRKDSKLSKKKVAVKAELNDLEGGRDENFGPHEMDALVQMCAKKIDIIDANFGMSGKNKQEVNQKMKTDAWADVTAAVNAAGGNNRTVQKVRRKWTDLKSRALAKYSDNHNATGGGAARKYTKWEDAVIKLKEERKSKLLVGMDGYDTGSQNVSCPVCKLLK